jgi:hypothetical protein
LSRLVVLKIKESKAAHLFEVVSLASSRLRHRIWRIADRSVIYAAANCFKTVGGQSVFRLHDRQTLRSSFAMDGFTEHDIAPPILNAQE